MALLGLLRIQIYANSSQQLIKHEACVKFYVLRISDIKRETHQLVNSRF